MAEPTGTRDTPSEQAPRARKRKSGSAVGQPVARRAFLAGSTALAAAAGYATFASEEAEKSRTGDTPADPRKVTYRETDHIRQFYARARF